MYAVLDFETSSLRADRRATEIAIVGLDENFEPQWEYESLINPGCFLEPMALTVSNLRKAEILRAPSFGDLWPDIAAGLTGRVIVGHNVDFDLRVLSNELQLIDIQCPDFSSVCTLKLSKELLSDRITKFRLGDLASYFGIEFENAHEALGDVRVTSELFLNIMANNPGKADSVRAMSQFAIDLDYEGYAALPSPRLRVSHQPLTDLQLQEICNEILKNPSVQKSGIVVVSGALERGETAMNVLLNEVGLRIKETPTTRGTAFLIKGTQSGKTKIERAKRFGRPVVSEEDALRIISYLNRA